MRRFLFPLIVFAALVVFLWKGLSHDPREVPSPLIGKPAPEFNLPQLQHPEVMVSAKDMRGQVWLLNVWGSWCIACREEHPALLDFARANVVPIVGLNWKDQRADADKWLADFGDPYKATAFDADGRVGIDFGVYGAPETFVIDKQGMIRMKHVGPITPEVVANKLMPLIKELNRG